MRRRGRPLGSRDRHGKARRFDPRWDAAYRQMIGKRVYEARIEQDVSASELGAAAGLDASSIHRIERGAKCCKAVTLCRIAYALGCLPSELLP